MLEGYIPILILLLLAIFIAIFVIGVSAILGPKKTNRRKLIPYESGIEPIGQAMRRMPIKFYVVALLFIVFDIEVVFLFPYALVFRDLGVYGLMAVGVFLFILVVGLAYEIKRGGLKWE